MNYQLIEVCMDKTVVKFENFLRSETLTDQD
jgi:hypothetical protein